MSRTTSAHQYSDLSSSSANLKTTGTKKGSAFWLSFLAILLALFLNALDITAIPTALPTIVHDLQGGDKFVWVGTGYGLASTAILLLCGRLADIFGRKPVMVASLVIFAIGSTLAGVAKNMDMLIVGRVVQGGAGGAIYVMAQIITSDLVSLAERGSYQGLIVLTYALASGVGPVIGGALADKASWRWLFYINLPLTGMALASVLIFLQVKSPKGSAWKKLSRVDWIGNVLMAAGSTLTLIGLTWGGVHYPWGSSHVLGPLIVGLVLMGLFFVYEINVPSEPTLPLDVLDNRTSAFGYVATFCHGIISISVIYYLPVLFQACKGASPLRSSVDTLPVALVTAPCALVSGFIVKGTRMYRPVNCAGWVLSMIGFGLLTLIGPGVSTGRSAGFQILTAAGAGTIYTATVFPVLAPLPVHRNAAALAFFAFCRTFAQTWGIAVSGVILQNQLKSRLPEAFASQFPEGMEIAFAAVPVINDLDEPLRSAVRDAFAESLATIWKVMIGISGLGLLTVFALKELPLVDHTDDTYGLQSQGTKIAETDMETDTEAHELLLNRTGS